MLVVIISESRLIYTCKKLPAKHQKDRRLKHFSKIVKCTKLGILTLILLLMTKSRMIVIIIIKK